MSLLWSYLKRYKKILIGALALATVNQVFSLLDPQIFRILIDRYATHALELPRQEFIRGVMLLLGGTVGVAFVSRVAKNFQDYFVNVITQRLGTKLYARSVEHSMSLPYAVFEDQRSGELLSKLQKARTDAQTLITGFVNIFFFSSVGIVFVLTYAFIVHWMIGAVYVLTIPVLGVSVFFISRKIKYAQQKVVRKMADLAGSTTETIRNVELVKSLGLEHQEISRLNTVNEGILTLELDKIKHIRTLSFIQGTLINALRSGLMFLMLWLMAEQAITLGQFFSLLFYSFFLFNPLSEFGTVASQYQEARASMEQLAQVLNIKPEDKPLHPVTLETLSHIEFNDLGFKYNTSDADALEGVKISIAAGQTIAFVGPSGSGKSTLVKLLLGLYKPTEGVLLFNGVDAGTVDMESLRKRIGFVAQETQLFAGTIRENLLFVRPDATDEECLTALKAASISILLERGRQGLDTKIGEGGIKLSGGERQRLAIARALLRKPDLIIFDEATSSLDSITENQITETIQGIEKVRPDLMMVLVAHRLSTVAHADRIYVLEKGRIVESGTHAELISFGNLYAALWRQQSASVRA